MRLGLLAALLAAALHLAWYHETRVPVRGAFDPPVPLVVPPGASTESIALELREASLLRHPAVFKALVLLRGAVPGATGGLVMVRKSVKQTKA